ncbi:MAG: hypothetical protein AAB391_01220 [Patescibacteria group bacterium]
MKLLKQHPKPQPPHPCLTALRQAIINLKNARNYYCRHPIRPKIERLNRASRAVSDVLDFIVNVYDGHLTRTLLKRAVVALDEAAKILEKRRPIRRGLKMKWFVAVKQALKSRYEQFMVLLGEGRAIYRRTMTDLALGHHDLVPMM